MISKDPRHYIRFLFLATACFAFLGGIGCGLTRAPTSAQTEYLDWVATAKPKDVDKIIDRYPRLEGILISAREWWEEQQQRMQEDRISSGKKRGTGLYEFQIGTRLEINVMNEDEISGTYTVDPDGAISFPFIGRVFVEGLTYPEVQTKIRKKLEKYIREPDVTINLSSKTGFTSDGRRISRARAGEIHVVGGGSGGGGRRSSVDFTGREKLVDVVLGAVDTGDGGTGGGSRQEIRGIKVFIPQEGKTHSKIVICDLHRYLKFGDQTQNIRLGPNYVVYIPTRWTKWDQLLQDLGAISTITGSIAGFDSNVRFWENYLPELDASNNN